MKSGSLKLLEPSGPVQACNGIALSLPLPLPILSPVKVCWYRGKAFGYNQWYSWQSCSMTNGPWNDDSVSASEKITQILWNPNVPYRFFALLHRACCFDYVFNPLNAELNPICYLLALLGAHHFLHVSRIRVKSLTLRLLMSYIYIYIWSTYSWCF